MGLRGAYALPLARSPGWEMVAGLLSQGDSVTYTQKWVRGAGGGVRGRESCVLKVFGLYAT